MAFPIPWAYRVSGFMPQPYFQSHALVGKLTYLRSCFVCGSFVAGGADPGRGAERFSERLFLDKSVVSHLCLEGFGLWANCENRGQRPQLQWRRRRLEGGF